MEILLLKLTLAPGLVAAVTLAGRRWGPQIAGWLGGLPVVVGPILLVFALERGEGFATDAAAGALVGLLSLTAFVLVYAWAARAMSWPPATALAWTASAVVTLALNEVDVANWLALVVVCGSFAAAAALLPRAPAELAPAPPRYDLLLRVAATAALVLALTGAADALGPRLSGLLASFPVLATVLATFTHAQEGAAAVAQLLRGFVTGLLAFAAFCFAVGELLPHVGTATAFLLSSGIALGVHGLSRAGRGVPRGAELARASGR